MILKKCLFGVSICSAQIETCGVQVEKQEHFSYQTCGLKRNIVFWSKMNDFIIFIFYFIFFVLCTLVTALTSKFGNALFNSTAGGQCTTKLDVSE